MLSREFIRKILSKEGSDVTMGECFIHTFITMECHPCIFRCQLRRVLYGNLYWIATDYGMLLLDQDYFTPSRDFVAAREYLRPRRPRL